MDRPFQTNDLRTSSSRLCAVCESGIGPGVFFLAPTVKVTLCVIHRDINYLRRARGERFIGDVAEHWARAGIALTMRRRAALDAHRRRVFASRARRRRPGSYAWPLMRLHAEALFAQGMALGPAVERLRHIYQESLARFPSHSTLRRWFVEGRWLSEPKRWSVTIALRELMRPLCEAPVYGPMSFTDVVVRWYAAAGPRPSLGRPPPAF